MDAREYIQVNSATKLLQAFPGSAQTDSVIITIYNVDTSTTEVNAAAMTAAGNDSFYYSWTPTSTGIRLVKFFNNTTGVPYYLYANVVGSITTSPSGSSGGSTLSTLRTRFLKLIDNYNANDLTGTNSSGEVADLCINEALQLIYAQLKASKFMQAYGSTALVSTASQSYIDLSAITDIDEIRSLKDTTNQISLLAIPAWQYFIEIANPSNVSGTPYRYCRIFNRIYLDPQPTTTITYTCEYIKIYPRLAVDADQALINNKYDDWIYSEAKVMWYQMEDPTNQALAFAVKERDQKRAIYINDIMSQFDEVTISKSHWRDRRQVVNWKHPQDGT